MDRKIIWKKKSGLGKFGPKTKSARELAAIASRREMKSSLIVRKIDKKEICILVQYFSRLRISQTTGH
jgi:hypothetical protein